MNAVFDMNAIASALFDRACPQLVRDFALHSVPASPSRLQEMLVDAMGQRPRVDALGESFRPERVFRAAVLSLASNMRSWRVILSRESRLREMLFEYNEREVVKAHRAGALGVTELAVVLGGQTAKKDALAILRWSVLLDSQDYGQFLMKHRDDLLQQSQVGARCRVSPPEISALLAAKISHPSTAPRTPGMASTLASEFLRNLGFSMFKPDRHVRRLLALWTPEVASRCRERAHVLAREHLRTKDRETIEYLTFALAGASLTPSGVPYSVADNLVWALGSYVERMGKETNRIYIAAC